MFTVPIYCGIATVIILKHKSILDDFVKCSTIVTEHEGQRACAITDSLIRTLVVGEDHRNSLHFGVDPIAILRSVKVRIFEGKRQGASTIEQQLVRTITGRYEKTSKRKFREQILAVMLSSKFSKDDLAACYLMVAYYGASLVGASGLKKLSIGSTSCINELIVAHLKYPRSSTPSEALIRKQLLRVAHLKGLLAETNTGLFLKKPSKTLSDSPLRFD